MPPLLRTRREPTPFHSNAVPRRYAEPCPPGRPSVPADRQQPHKFRLLVHPKEIEKPVFRAQRKIADLLLLRPVRIPKHIHALTAVIMHQTIKAPEKPAQIFATKIAPAISGTLYLMLFQPHEDGGQGAFAQNGLYSRPSSMGSDILPAVSWRIPVHTWSLCLSPFGLASNIIYTYLPDMLLAGAPAQANRG